MKCCRQMALVMQIFLGVVLVIAASIRPAPTGAATVTSITGITPGQMTEGSDYATEVQYHASWSC